MPRKIKGHSLKEKISVRVTKEQKEILEMIAEYGGLDLSDLIRSLITILIYNFKMGRPIALIEGLEREDNVYVPNEKEGKL